jgi:hypothetical protein
LKESSNLEHDADVVMFLHRKDEMAEETECIIGKNRDGAKGTVYLRFHPEYVSFEQARVATDRDKSGLTARRRGDTPELFNTTTEQGAHHRDHPERDGEKGGGGTVDGCAAANPRTSPLPGPALCGVQGDMAGG